MLTTDIVGLDKTGSVVFMQDSRGRNTFRSSTGFGKALTNAGEMEWGGKIIEDQVDAIQWAISKGIADPQRVAVLGGSFGGYSTLAGLTLFPELFACGVDACGPSNLVTFLESVPSYWKPMLY